jgi:hypothetical protein
MDLGSSMHHFDMERKTTMDRSGTLVFHDSVKAIQENMGEYKSIESMEGDTQNDDQSDLHSNGFGSVTNPFVKRNFQKRKTMDPRYLNKINAALTDFDSDMNSIGVPNVNSSSITLNRFPQTKTSDMGRKSELFNRNPHFLQTMGKQANLVNSKDRTKSVDKGRDSFHLQEQLESSGQDWLYESSQREFHRQSSNKGRHQNNPRLFRV